MLLKFFKKLFKKEKKTEWHDNINLILGDITKKAKDYEVIVNAANTTLLGGGGVDGSIHRVAGPKLLEECKTLNGCKTGQAKMTDAYNLPCKKIIHTVGPVYNATKKEECAELLGTAYRNCMEMAKENGLKSIAFPSISTGIYGFPVKYAAKIALSEAMRFLSYNPEMQVVWILFSEDDFNTYNEILQQLIAVN